MFNIGGLFEKIKKLHAREVGVRVIVVETVLKFTGITVPINDIEIGNSTLHIKNLNQSAKSIMFIKKQPILEEINNIQKIFVIRDIKY